MKKSQLLNKLFKGYYLVLGGILIATIFYVVFSLLSPLIFSFMIDQIIDLQPITNRIVQDLVNSLGGVDYVRNNLWIGAILILVIYLFIGVSIFFRGKWNAQLSEGVTEKLRNWLYSHLSLLPYSYHVSAKSGDLIQRCTSDVNQLRKMLGGQIAELVYALGSAFIAIADLIFNLSENGLVINDQHAVDHGYGLFLFREDSRGI